MIIYGDFNCPYSYLASQRADRLARAGTVLAEWRAVEHDRWLAVTGTRSEADRAVWESELAEVAALALPGEHAPQAPPPVVSNTGAAVAAYAEAVSDGIADELRRRLFGAIWAEGRHISSASRCAPGRGPDVAAGRHRDRLASPDIPSLLNRDPDLARIVRRSGGTIARTAGRSPPRLAADPPLADDWLALPSQVIPAVIGPDGILRSDADRLRYLGDLSGQPAQQQP